MDPPLFTKGPCVAGQRTGGPGEGSSPLLSFISYSRLHSVAYHKELRKGQQVCCCLLFLCERAEISVLAGSEGGGGRGGAAALDDSR